MLHRGNSILLTSWFWHDPGPTICSCEDPARQDLLIGSGVEIVRLPPRSPNLNAYAERFVRSIKDECLNRMIFFGEPSLRKATREFAAHYHTERNHQGLNNRLIEPDRRDESTLAVVRCVQRLGGMLSFYHRAAA